LAGQILRIVNESHHIVEDTSFAKHPPKNKPKDMFIRNRGIGEMTRDRAMCM